MNDNGQLAKVALLSAAARHAVATARHSYLLRQADQSPRVGHGRRGVRLTDSSTYAKDDFTPRPAPAELADADSTSAVAPFRAPSPKAADRGRSSFLTDPRGAISPGRSMNRVCRRAIDARLRRTRFPAFSNALPSSKRDPA